MRSRENSFVNSKDLLSEVALLERELLLFKETLKVRVEVVEITILCHRDFRRYISNSVLSQFKFVKTCKLQHSSKFALVGTSSR